MSVVLDAWIEGIGVRGPGLEGWAATADVLAGRAPYRDAPTRLSPPASLPPAERRRVGRGVKVALEVAHEAVAHAGRDATGLPSIFASSSGDGDNCDAICRELTGDRLISPTRFHNSVHNAPSGYWGIAARATAPSTSLCAFDASFAAGLDDALTQLAAGADAVLLVAYDAPYPEPLFATRPTPDAFGVALVLARRRGPRALARLSCGDAPRTAVATVLADAALERWRIAIPAARALPLLDAIACGSSRRACTIDDVNGRKVALAIDPVVRLDRAAIAARIPHAGDMVLLDAVDSWDDERIACRASTHRDPDHPLRVAGALSSVCGVEYAAQAMAVHGSLLAARDADADVDAAAPRVGFIASVRDVRMEVDRLDTVEGALTIVATRASGDGARVLYAFEVRDGDRVLVSGRAAVVLAAADGWAGAREPAVA